MEQPVRVPKAAALVAASLRRRIVEGALDEGSVLPSADELMRSYDVSRPTLREALRVLESESLISVKRGAKGGARVSAPRPEVTARHAALVLRLQGATVEDVYVARSIVEPAAVRLLAARARSDASILASLRTIHEQSAPVLHDQAEYTAMATRFHHEVISLSGNRTLSFLGLILMSIVEPQNRAAFEASELGGEIRVAAQREHGQLLDSLERGDAAAAAELWSRHLDSTMQETLRALGPGSRVEPDGSTL